MKKLIAITISAALIVTPTFAADKSKHRHARKLSPAIQLMAADLAKWRGISSLCRMSDGTNLNAAYWAPKKAVIPQPQMGLFARTVKQETKAFIAQNNGPAVALKCDDWMDDIRNEWDAADPISDAPPSGPICFDEPLELWRCKGTGELDPFAGFDALLSGY